MKRILKAIALASAVSVIVIGVVVAALHTIVEFQENRA